MSDQDFQSKHGIERERVFNDYAMILQLEFNENPMDFDAFEKKVNSFLDDAAAVKKFLTDYAPLFTSEDARRQFLLTRYGFAA